MAARVILSLVEKIGSLLIDEANYLLQVKPEVESLHKELKLMIVYLKEADAIQHKSDRVKEWVRQLRDLVFEAEDTIDAFIFEMAQRRQHGAVWKMIKFPNILCNADKLRGVPQDIEGKIQKLSNDKIKYEIHPIEKGQTSAQPHLLESSGDKTFPYEVVGLQREADELAKLLMKGEPLGLVRVVSITGMGGLGKTTLARKIYNRGDVKRHFDCQAWVYISKEYKLRNVLYSIIEQVMLLKEAEKVALASMGARILKRRLSDFLKEKKNHLFVFDDVWRKKDWDKLKGLLLTPCDSKKCRVLLTTRDEGVARYADPIALPHKLQFLDEEKSLKLFLKVIFQSPVDRHTEASLNKEMKSLAKKIVAKCDGLPLAIVVLGGLLWKKMLSVAAWNNVLNNVNWHLDSKDTEIRRDRLIRLWVAEGFLEPRGNLTMEDEGGECLEELMQRNLIQVASGNSSGVPDSFIIHDLLLNLAISKGGKGNFLNISTPQKSLYRCRWVALRDKCSEDNMVETSYHCCSLSSSKLLRSLICFTEISRPSLFGQFKLLNVLDIEDAPDIKNLPNEIGKLIFLKYLNLSRTNLETLPPWVGNLYNLQTLNLFATKIESLPVEILKLGKLRHLLFYSRNLKQTFNDSNVKSGIGIRRRPSSYRHIHDLSELQTQCLPAGDWIEDGLEILTNLRLLGVLGRGHMERFGEALSQALVNLVRLGVLYLIEFECGKIFLPSFSSHVYLYDIFLHEVIEKLPNLQYLPPNLTRLQLASIHLREDMMGILEKLPELKDLLLEDHPYDGVVMKCSARGFPKLENLTLDSFEWLRYWTVEEGAMPNLRMLEMNCLYELHWIPSGLRHITTLQKLTLAMPEEFLERVKEDGEDWENIKHVPSINTREEEIPYDGIFEN